MTLTNALIRVMSSAVVVMVALSLAADAEAKKKRPQRTVRSETHEYSISAGYEGCPSGTGVGCAKFDRRRKERYVSIEVADVTGTPAPFLVTQYEAESSTRNSWHCGKTSSPIFLPKRTTRVEVMVALATPLACPEGVGVSGSLFATFTNCLPSPASPSVCRKERNRG